jgi:acetyl-CoA carboxylase biotin carboxylase subunit
LKRFRAQRLNERHSAAKPACALSRKYPVHNNWRLLRSLEAVWSAATKVMFKKILIANRGEIALRVICACKELGVKTVAVYSDADRNSLHVRFADEAICIGPPRSSESYLNIPAVISAAEITNVDAIHPGYGLLSENANFAEVCESSHIKFIGPPPEVIRLMGEKEKARQAMKKANVPILPGSDGVIASGEEAREWATQIGYPVIVKASAGGGGRGMRVIRGEAELEGSFNAAQSEAAAAFGNGNLYMEKFIERPRHIEFQVLGDSHGRVISLGERECSIQRRHQKLLEESPSTRVTQEMRTEIGKKLEESLSEIGYVNAGTVEFLMDEDGSLHFIEMNTRIQVEHPVTEMVTSLDLVKSQILLATGAKITEIIPKVDRTGQRGHAIECRINAEHPEKFTPSAGKIKTFHIPGGLGVRVDTAAYAEGVIPPYYDSLIAKLITFGKDRAEAIMRMQRALEMFIVEGIHTTIPLHRRILADDEFRAGNIDTKYVERLLARIEEERTEITGLGA